MIGIINYGVGNLQSIQNIIKHVGGECRILNSPNEIKEVDKLILPGVGSFDHGVEQLSKGDWINNLNDYVNQENIILGICLGMQLMCNSSQEGKLKGLGWINADVQKFQFEANSNLKIPHMGWEDLNIKNESDLFKMNDESRFYFVHSYHVVCNIPSIETSSVDYGQEITTSFQCGNIYGVQFHPEKSHKFGKEFFKRFILI
jgi:imidazole glycerol-phosphate synthase subunit HisH